MARTLPSLTALRAFEAVARHLSFTRAADELNVTQGAVSHQVKALEAELGVRLLNRQRHGLTLSAAGQACVPFVRDAFDGLAAGFAQLRARDDGGVLTVSVSPNFAAKWLVHRVGRFLEAHPAIDLRISAAMRHTDFAREDIDLAVRHGEGHWPELHVTLLAHEALFPVCSPGLMRGRHALRRPDDLRHHALLHLDDRRDWVKWLDAAGVGSVDLSQGPVFNQASLAIDAAVAGQGVALGRTILVASDLLAGRLVRPFEPVLSVAYAYYIVCPKVTAQRAKVAAFRDWLLAEAAVDREGLESLAKSPRSAPRRPLSG